MNKEELRKKYLLIRRNMKKDDKKIADYNIFNKIISSKEYISSNLLLIYVSLEEEVDTINIINYSLSINKKVAVPKCEKNIINFYYINNMEQLQKGRFQILEPVPINKVEDFSNSICVVPGVTFDETKNRIGYGKGFYDCFLKNYKGTKIGLCYEQCLCKKINSKEYDIKMDIVISN